MSASAGDSRIIHVIRAMAWCRARGELESMLASYYDDMDEDKFERMHELLGEFVTAVEDEGLAE